MCCSLTHCLSLWFVCAASFPLLCTFALSATPYASPRSLFLCSDLTEDVSRVTVTLDTSSLTRSSSPAAARPSISLHLPHLTAAPPPPPHRLGPCSLPLPGLTPFSFFLHPSEQTTGERCWKGPGRGTTQVTKRDDQPRLPQDAGQVPKRPARGRAGGRLRG